MFANFRLGTALSERKKKVVQITRHKINVRVNQQNKSRWQRISIEVT